MEEEEWPENAHHQWNLRREIVRRLRHKADQAEKPPRPPEGPKGPNDPNHPLLALLLVILVSLLGTLGCENSENIKRGVLSGVVLDTLGNRITGAKVTSHRSLFVAETGQDGRFDFTSLDSGSHRLSVEKYGFHTGSRTVYIDNGEVQQDIDFRLEPIADMISWQVLTRASDTVIITAQTREPMSCMVYYQGEHLPQIRTPYSAPGENHRFVLTPLRPFISYSFFLEGITSDNRKYRSASGSFHPLPPGDLPGSPSMPLEVKVDQTNRGPRISWSYTSPEPLKGFRLIRAEDSGSPVVIRDENLLFSGERSFLDEEAKPGMFTRYSIAAVDLDGNVSTFTAETTFLPAGTLPKDTAWKLSWGTLNLNGDIVVPADVRLAIEPGVTIRIAQQDDSQQGVDPDRCEVVVEGRLQIYAREDKPVVFTSASSFPNRKDWLGIRLRTPRNKTGSELEFVEIFNAEKGISIFDAPASISHLVARYCETGLELQNASGAAFSDLTFIECRQGIFAGDSQNVSLSEFTCTGGDSGVNLLGNRGISLSVFDIRNVFDTGLKLSDKDSLVVQNGLVTSKRLGVYVNGGVATLTFLTVDAPDAILIDQIATPSIRNSILVNRKTAGTGKGINDQLSGRSYPYNNIFGFQTPVYNCNQNGGPVLNVDPKFIGGMESSFDYHLSEDSPVMTASDKGGEPGAYGNL